MAAGGRHSQFVDGAGRLLACGKGAAAGHGDAEETIFLPTPVFAMAGVRMRSVAAGYHHSLALSMDGRVYSWGANKSGHLGHGERLARPSPTLVEGLEGVRGFDAGVAHSLAVTQSGIVFIWGHALLRGSEDQDNTQDTLRPIIVEGFGGVRVRQVCAGVNTAFAIGEGGELFSWGRGEDGLLGHGDMQGQPSPKRVEALQDVMINSISVGFAHALALTEDGLVYAWGENVGRAVLGTPDSETELLPKPVEALRKVRVGSIVAAPLRSYAVADTGELWAWGCDSDSVPPLGNGEQIDCHLPKPIESLRGIKVDAMAAGPYHTLAWADDGSVYAWGKDEAAETGALGLGPEVSDAQDSVLTPQRIPALRVACGL
jgi:alpha-tubulin suppressor-like RCC1 family protein